MAMNKIQKWDEVNGNTTPEEKMTAFLESATDSYAILQLRRGEDTRDEQFMSYSYLQRNGKEPDIDHYEVVYAAALPAYRNQTQLLEGLYEKFNIDHPSDFRGHSLSVSDIVALRVNGVVSSHYVDSFGFKELLEFIKPENYLKAAEMAMEDDYGMLDGIINNGPREEKRSVLEQLKEKAAETPAPIPSKKDERELV